MRAIETRYMGYRFRSRLEARYAVLFDHYGLTWEYEKEGYELPNGEWYLPDFWFPYPLAVLASGSGFWCEIKGCSPTESEMYRCEMLCQITGQDVYLIVGGFSSTQELRLWTYSPIRERRWCHTDPVIEVKKATKHGLRAWGWLLGNIGNCQRDFLRDNGGSLYRFGERSGVEAARSARFEFGESG